MIAKQYAHDITSGKIPAGEYTVLAAQRFIRDLERDDIYFDDTKYQNVVKFFNDLLFKGQKWNGKPLKLAPWQEFIIANLYGLRNKNGTKKHRRAYIQVARKNGKTTLLGGLALYHLLAEGENAPQIIVGANDEKQARICTNAAGNMARNAGLLDYGVKTYQYQGKYHTIAYGDGILEAISKELKSKDGSSPSLAVIDEMHEAPNAGLLNVLRSGQGARLDPLLIIITTAGFNKMGPCYRTVRETCTQILKGIKEDDAQFALLYEPDIGDDWEAVETWEKANPMIGHIDTILPFLKDEYTSAKNEGKVTEVNFKTKCLNIWTDSSAAWISDKDWCASSQYSEAINPKKVYSDLLGCRCFGGLDLASVSDFNAFVLYFPERGAVLPFFWVTERMVKENDYYQWVEDGFANIAGKDVIDFAIMGADIKQILKDFNVFSIGYDRFLSSHGLIQELDKEGAMLEDVAQTHSKLSLPTKELEKMVLNGDLEHYMNPVLRWQIGNVEIIVDREDNYRPSKGKSQNKIDGVSAFIMALYESIEPRTKFQIFGL